MTGGLGWAMTKKHALTTLLVGAFIPLPSTVALLDAHKVASEPLLVGQNELCSKFPMTCHCLHTQMLPPYI